MPILAGQTPETGTCKHPARWDPGSGKSPCHDCPRKAAGNPPPAYRQPPGTVAVLEPATVSRRPARQSEPIDGQMLWSLVKRYLCHYVAFRSEAEASLVTAWVFHAAARNRDDTGMGQLIWRASPRLLITSRKRGSGKSTLLDLVAYLTRSRRGKVPKITPAKIAKVTGKYYETVLLDEARTIFGAGSGHMELQGCMLAGYTCGSSYEVADKSLDLFGAIVYAAKENLITETRTDTMGDLLDRSLKVTLDPPSYPMPEVGERAEDDGDLLARALIAWTDAVREELKQAARELADQDYREARAYAKANPNAATRNLRVIQITRPLRACARVAGPEFVTEDGGTRTGALEGAEADLRAALDELIAGSAGDEARAALEEVRRRADTWDDEDEDEDWGTGRVVFAPERDNDQLADLAASLPTDEPPAARPAAPAAARLWAAVKVTPGADGKPGMTVLSDHLGDMNAAAGACSGDAGTALSWTPGTTEPGTWLAVTRAADGTDITYAISAGK